MGVNVMLAWGLLAGFTEVQTGRDGHLVIVMPRGSPSLLTLEKIFNVELTPPIEPTGGIYVCLHDVLISYK
jgi:hypothetical protein